jgi:V8-like Glu-specific endopeptidase
MKREPISTRLLHKGSSLICMLLIIMYASVVVGQEKSSNDKILSSSNKLSDSRYLKLSDEKKNWPAITTPKFKKQSIKSSAIDPKAVVVYDVITQTVNRSGYGEIQIQTQSGDTSSKIYQSYGIFQGNEQIETVFPSDGRRKVSPTVDFPWRTICKIYITFPDGNHFAGSGVIIGRNDGISFHCLTAGHCVYRKEYGGWAKTVEIIPALDNDYTPFYSAWAVKIKTNEGWTIDSMAEYDWACIILDRQIGNFTGWMDKFTTSDLDWYRGTFYCAGYPIDLDFGLCLYYDSDSGRIADEYFHWYYMDASDGQDGMPIWAMVRNKKRIVSIHLGDDDGSGSNVGLRLNADKFNQLTQWLHEDQPPIDRPDLVDDGAKWANFKPKTVVRGFSQLMIGNDVRNIGTAYSGNFSVAYYASLDKEVEPNNDFLIGTKEITTIPPFIWRDSDWSGVFPEPIPEGEYYVGWVIDPDDQVIEFDESNNTGIITSKKLVVRDPYIEIITPNGGEVFAIGEENIVQWFTAGGFGLVTLDASYDGGLSWQNLATNFPDSGYYKWNIPQSQQSAFCCLIKITDTIKNLTDISDTMFIIETRPTIPGIPQNEREFSNKEELLFTWTSSNDSETGISGYHIQVGTSPYSNDLADTLIENKLSYIAKGKHNQKVYARVRAKNGVGLFSHWSASSNGILVDLTPPILQGGPFDEGEFSGSDSVLFKWNAAVDEESGVIMNYKLQVGTAIGLNDVFDKWINRRLQYKVLGKHGQTLYARIKVHNAAIGVSDWSDWSDGITIDVTPPTAPGKPYSESQTVNFYDIPFFWDSATEDLSGISNYHLKVVDLNADSQVVFDQKIGNVVEYMVPGRDGQKLLASVQAQNKAGVFGPWSIADLPVIVQLTPVFLKLIKASRAYPEEDWENAIDNDIVGWDGTVTAYTTVSSYPYAIFGFIGGGSRRIEKIKLLTDTKVGYKERWVTHFRVLYSLTGIEEQDFILLLDGQKQRGDWEEYTFPEQTVKFIKLIVDQPTSSTTSYCQLGEFQVFGRVEYVKTEKAEVAITYGTPTDPVETWSNAIDGDIQGWDGTATVMTIDPPAYVIFNFADQSIKNVSKIRLLTDTGVRFSFRWLREFHIEVSTTGTKRSDFSNVTSARKHVGDWESFYFDPAPARYIKLVLAHPDPDEADYCQVGEVEIYTQIDSVSAFENFVNIPINQSESLTLVEMPNSYYIEQNYPNPFNPETTIRFQLPDDSKVTLTIYNMIGQEITTLINGSLSAGYHSFIWNGRDAQGKKAPSGVYLYQFRAGEYRVTKKMILLE